jgi:hypothetical protein
MHAPHHEGLLARPAYAGATRGLFRNALGQWPTWLTNPEKIRSFTVD